MGKRSTMDIMGIMDPPRMAHLRAMDFKALYRVVIDWEVEGNNHDALQCMGGGPLSPAQMELWAEIAGNRLATLLQAEKDLVKVETPNPSFAQAVRNTV